MARLIPERLSQADLFKLTKRISLNRYIKHILSETELTHIIIPEFWSKDYYVLDKEGIKEADDAEHGIILYKYTHQLNCPCVTEEIRKRVIEKVEKDDFEHIEDYWHEYFDELIAYLADYAIKNCCKVILISAFFDAETNMFIFGFDKLPTPEADVELEIKVTEI